MQPESAYDLGIVQLQSEWLSLSYDNCALNISLLKPSDAESLSNTQNNSGLSQQFAPDCSKHPIGLYRSHEPSDNNQYLVMITQSGLLEVMSLELSVNNQLFQLQLNRHASFALPDMLYTNDEAWHSMFKGFEFHKLVKSVDAKRNDAERTDAERTDAERTDAERTDAERTDAARANTSSTSKQNNTQDQTIRQRASAQRIADSSQLYAWLARWQVFYHDQSLVLSYVTDPALPGGGSGFISIVHPLNSLQAAQATQHQNVRLLQPILERKLWLSVNTAQATTLEVLQQDFTQAPMQEGEPVQSSALNLLQSISAPSRIEYIGVSPNALNAFIITEDQTLLSYFLVNESGQFTLRLGFSVSLAPTPLFSLGDDARPKASTDEEQAHKLNDVQAVQQTSSITNSPNAAKTKVIADSTQNMLLVVQDNGRATILNSVSGDIAEQMQLSPASHINYARSELLLSHPSRFSLYQLKELQGLVSLNTLFGENMYPGYPEPAYTWQTSVASDLQSPKFSVVPLLMGSIKASMLALIVALPLALGSAIYTAYFAKAKVRNAIKPSIEMLEAIPSVIIGFIAAVWLAPFAEKYLISIFAVIILLPFVVIVISVLHGVLRPKIEHTRFANWELFINAILLLLAIVFIFVLSLLITDWSMQNDSGQMLESIAGVTLSKTAVVVSLALGIAIAPTIYTLIDDALYEVPDGIKQASFALGATPIQTLTRVVLVVALPSIIAAVMLGFGRAFGETMIVLMVTGNTPIANWDLFSGLRTLTSNLAIELQEAQINSTLYYILFLTASILFVFTFVVNTIAALLKRNMRRNN